MNQCSWVGTVRWYAVSPPVSNRTIHIAASLQPLSVSAQLPGTTMRLYICLLARSMHTSIFKKRPVPFVCLPTRQRGDTRAGPGHRDPWPAASPEPLPALGFRRAPAAGTRDFTLLESAICRRKDITVTQSQYV